MIIKKIMQEITFLGSIVFYILFLVWFLIKKEYNYFFMPLVGLVLIYSITFIIRIFYFKPRPEKQEYKNFIEKIDASSFPSIHDARATFLFIFLTIYLLRSFILISCIFALTLLVLYSRIYLKKHDIIDTIGGVILGILSFIISLFI